VDSVDYEHFTTGEGHTSQALDAAARHYIRCRGDIMAVPVGTYTELLTAARDADGGLGPEAIAEILDTNELPVAASTTTNISVGND
jgi:hypothetical protein